MSLFVIDVTVVVWCEAVGPGCEYTARITDGANARFFGGSGPTALDAVAWALDECVRRGLLGREHSPARSSSARPGDGLSVTPPSSPPSAPPPPSPRRDRHDLSREDAPTAKGEIGCFERRIPRRAEPLLHGQAPPRRAVGGRR